MGIWKYGVIHPRLDGPVYCDCGEPTPGFWGVECAACRRLIEGAIGARLAR